MKVIDAEIVATAAATRGFPRDGLPEVAFLGRSNVGKSTLLNRLAARRALARTSATPGKTRLVHFFRLRLRVPAAPDAAGEPAERDRTLLFVDLPGWGYARVPKEERASWRRLVESYLTGRAPLRVALLLHDVRRDPGDDEHDLVAWLAQQGIETLLVVTKADKLPRMQRERRLRELCEALPVPPERVIATSAVTGLGMDALWEAILART